MLHPLLYTSHRLSPLRPYNNVVFSRLLKADIQYNRPSPRWIIPPPIRTHATRGKDAADKQSEEEKQTSVEQDPRIIFSENEFRTVQEEYRMPKNVRLPRVMLR